MTRYTDRYSDRYTDRAPVKSILAPCSQRVEGREQRVEGREQRVEVPPLTRAPQGALVLEPCAPTLSVVTHRLNSESQLQTARAFDSVVAS
jgi:hypothetical protein